MEGESKVAPSLALCYTGAMVLNPETFVCLASDEQWLQERTHVVTGSEVAILLGLSPWRNEGQLRASWGQEERLKDTANMWWGRQMEDANREAYSKLLGVPVLGHNGFYVRGALGATTDAFIPAGSLLEALDATKGYIGTSAATYWRKHVDILSSQDNSKPILVELKNVQDRYRKDWAKVPGYYEAQVQAQLYATGLDVGVIVAKLGSADIRAHVVLRDEFMIEDMVIKAQQFLEEMNQ